MEVLPEALRFLPLVRSLATRTHEEIAPHIELDQIQGWAILGVNDAFRHYRSRQGLTLRMYLSYRIQGAIYDALRHTVWPSIDAEKRYKFAKKSNELLLYFAVSAEGTVKRSIRMEEEEMMHLLRLLVVIGLLIWRNTPRGEIQRQWALALAGLGEQQKRFLQKYYDQDMSLEESSGLTGSEAFRFHMRILQTLEAQLRL